MVALKEENFGGGLVGKEGSRSWHPAWPWPKILTSPAVTLTKAGSALRVARQILLLCGFTIACGSGFPRMTVTTEAAREAQSESLVQGLLPISLKAGSARLCPAQTFPFKWEVLLSHP